MLVHLRMQNIALIDDVSLDFEPGFNILTGETGAGKSILLDGINLALGSRVQRDMLHTDSANSQVDLFFVEEDPRILGFFRDASIPVEDGEILLTRSFTAAGRSVCRINGQIVTAAQMKEAARLLIDIHGQHEHQSLLDTAKHREILDRFDDRIPGALAAYQKLFHEYRDLDRELAGYLQDEQDKERLLSLMEYEQQEIEEAAVGEGEEDALRAERRRLYNSERMQEAAGTAYMALSGDENGASALTLLNESIAALARIEEMDPEALTPMIDSIREGTAILEDIGYQLQAYVDGLEMDPARLTEVEERLDLIRRIHAKYGKDLAAVQAYYADLLVRIDKLRNIRQTKEELRTRRDACEKKLAQAARTLRDLREKAAASVSADVTRILETLQFQDPLFQIRVQPLNEYKTYGTEDIEFCVRTNVGDAVKPLVRIASGGEMSRIMLAIKTVLARRDEIPTLIFDEIDSGISGRTAQSVAEKMAQIARFHQVLCVTHLPQIAAMADAQFRIEKEVENGRTHTIVTHLQKEAMVDELARLIGGVRITETVMQSARELKEQADQRKTQILQEEQL